MSTATVLAESVQFLSDPAHWCQHFTMSDDGTASCAVGALLRSTGGSATREYMDAIAVLAGVLGPDYHPQDDYGITVWNDNPDRQHSEVVELFQKALAHAVAEES